MERILGIGLMSGTSLDGLDICLSEFQFPIPGFKILLAETIPYSPELKQKLKIQFYFRAKSFVDLIWNTVIFSVKRSKIYQKKQNSKS